jgi:hypothetical protein
MNIYGTDEYIWVTEKCKKFVLGALLLPPHVPNSAHFETSPSKYATTARHSLRRRRPPPRPPRTVLNLRCRRLTRCGRPAIADSATVPASAPVLVSAPHHPPTRA